MPRQNFSLFTRTRWGSLGMSQSLVLWSGESDGAFTNIFTETRQSVTHSACCFTEDVSWEGGPPVWPRTHVPWCQMWTGPYYTNCERVVKKCAFNKATSRRWFTQSLCNWKLFHMLSDTENLFVNSWFENLSGGQEQVEHYMEAMMVVLQQRKRKCYCWVLTAFLMSLCGTDPWIDSVIMSWWEGGERTGRKEKVILLSFFIYWGASVLC